MIRSYSAGIPPSLDRLTPGERALREALVRKVDLGRKATMTRLRRVDVANRVLEATAARLDERGFPVVVVRGGPFDDAELTTPSLIATARATAATKRASTHAIALIVKDAHLLPPGRLNRLAQQEDVVVVAAAKASAPPPPEGHSAAGWLQHRRFALVPIAATLALLALSIVLWTTARHGPPELAAGAPATSVAQGSGSRDRVDLTVRSGPSSDQATDATAAPSAAVPPAVAPPAAASSSQSAAEEAAPPAAAGAPISLSRPKAEAETVPPPPGESPAEQPAKIQAETAPPASTSLATSSPKEATEPAPPLPNAPASIEPSAEAAQLPSGAPGLLIRARPGETLETIYQRVYRGRTPPPFATVAALNPERIRPGDILTLPAPVNGWAEQNDGQAVSNGR